MRDIKNPPDVDIFITCAGEDPDTIINTAEAACASDYPSNALRVFVLDDSGSEELSKRVSTIKRERPILHYLARKKGKVHDFKAGNLNFGYQHVKKLNRGPAPFIAALDADMIPSPKWLSALVPHLIKDANLALIQPPQRFYDVPSPDLLSQGLDVNYCMTEPLRETMGSTWCGGSGYVIRRAALDSIGGFPTGTIGEDLHCSNVLLGKGWKTRHVDERLQHGRVPDSYKTHIKQQSRWHVGRIQVAVAMRFYIFGDKVKKLSFRQRCAALIATTLSLTNISTTVSLILLPLAMLLGRPLVISPNHQGHRRLLSMVVAAVMSEWLDVYVVSLITGYKIAMSETYATYWAAPCK
ncbi:MAG: hypothetical protein M1814_005428 [Vezdaea aestivalis]|nr:MAG: hypothetical protein M1814_005428 [Vezdaea aestivalis]